MRPTAPLILGPAPIASMRRWTASDWGGGAQALSGVLARYASAARPCRRHAAPARLLVLDEPTNGLDPQGTREVRALVRDLASDGATVFVSSHLLAEVEQMCTHVGVMRTGRLVVQGTLESLGSTAAARVRVDSAMAPQAAELLGRLGLLDIRVAGDEASGELGPVPPEDVTEALVLGGVPVRQLTVDRPHLEELFVSLTGEGFDVDE